MNIARRTIYLLLPAALLLAALAPAGTSAAFQPPPPPTAAPTAAPETRPPGCGTKTTGVIFNSTGQNILDGEVITSTIAITTAATYLWQVIVGTHITHANSSDLDIELISPHGTVVTLSSNNGGANANVFNGTYWFDAAAGGAGPGVVTLASFISGTTSTPLTPEEPLASLNGENPNGTWKLVVKDTLVNGKTGRLNDWSLQVEALTTAPHPIVYTYVSGGNTPIPDNGPPVTRTLPIPYSIGPLGDIT